MKRITTSLIASAICLTASAQIHLTADLQNNHLWRGMEVADGCLILTDLGYTFANGHMTLGLWGGTNTQGPIRSSTITSRCARADWSSRLWTPITSRLEQRITIGSILIIRHTIQDDSLTVR